MLTAIQRAEFDDRGLVRLPAAFGTGDAAAMQDAVWSELERLHDIRRADPASWRPGRPSGLQGIKELPVFAAIGGTTTRAAIDDLLGAGRWSVPRSWGFLLVSFRECQAWTVPSSGWHIDSDTGFAPEPLFGLRIYSFLSDVAPRSGGTVVVLGSHRLVARFSHARPLAERQAEAPRDFRRAFMDSDPWLRALTRQDEGVDRSDRFVREHSIAGVPVLVAELTGCAGDVVLAHPWLLHARAPHSAPAPRFVRSKDVYRTDLPPGSRVFGRQIGKVDAED